MNELVFEKIEKSIPLLQEVQRNLLEALALAEKEVERPGLSEAEIDEANMFASQLQIACDSVERALDDTDDMVSR